MVSQLPLCTGAPFVASTARTSPPARVTHPLCLSPWALPQIVEEIVSGIAEKIPKPIDVREVLAKYPVLYEESMNTVLLQEVIR